MNRVAIVRFPGSNCDFDTLRAAQSQGGDAFFVWHRDTDLKGADIVILPGGFSYGDYLRTGAIARFSPIMQAVERHAAAGGPLLGIDTPPAAPTSTHAGSDGPVLPAARSEVPPPADQLVLRTADNDADGNPAAWRFDIVREAGCLWLRNAN